MVEVGASSRTISGFYLVLFCFQKLLVFSTKTKEPKDKLKEVWIHDVKPMANVYVVYIDLLPVRE